MAARDAGDGRDALGRRGEAEAEKHLRGLGYRIVGRRERVLRGDIDLVAVDGRTVVFVEVRSRTGTEHGHPAETVGPQ
jgi:putative endonuclease